MITQKDISDMYIHLRKTNQSIPTEALDFMKQACEEKLDALNKGTIIDAAIINVDIDTLKLITISNQSKLNNIKKGQRYKITLTEN